MRAFGESFRGVSRRGYGRRANPVKIGVTSRARLAPTGLLSRSWRDERPQAYFSVFLDDPGFAEPVWAALFENDGKAQLVWPRPKRSASQQGVDRPGAGK
ncbi:MAG: DUF736 family protein [Parvularculaceae bacterium]